MNGAAKTCFVDTNVLLYTLDSTSPAKQAVARTWRDALWEQRAGRLSWQVLNEFYVNATAKMGAPAATARQMVTSYAQWETGGFTLHLLERAWHWVDQGGVSYWDALIVSAAERSGCHWLLSEDFQHERSYGTVRVLNPFLTEPAAFFSL